MEDAIQISKNFIKGETIKDAQELLKLANEKKSVYHECWGIKPASVIINMNFYIVMRAINYNGLYKTIKFKPLKTNNN